jgi:hypothetical protein
MSKRPVKAMTYKGLKLVPSEYVSDIVTVRRTLTERLFDSPWRPFQSHKEVMDPRLFIVAGDTIICSFRSFALLSKGITQQLEGLDEK